MSEPCARRKCAASDIRSQLAILVAIRDRGETSVECGDCDHAVPCCSCSGWRMGVADWLMEEAFIHAEQSANCPETNS